MLPKLFGPTVRKKCYSGQEIFLKFKAEGQEFGKILRSLEQFFLTVGPNNFGNKIPFHFYIGCDKQSDYNVEIDFQNDTKAGNLQEVQELYRKTSSIEAHQVATDLEEATGIKIQEDIEFQEIPGFMVQEILGIRNYQNSSCVTNR